MKINGEEISKVISMRYSSIRLEFQFIMKAVQVLSVVSVVMFMLEIGWIEFTVYGIKMLYERASF